MPTIYAIGETIYDIIFRDGQPVAAKAGGAMLNTAVSLGRLGLPVRFISEYGHDRAGEEIDAFLKANGVDTRNVYRYDDGKTAIALAFLNERNEAAYSFYKIYPVNRLEVDIPHFERGDIVLFGAFFSLMKEVRSQMMAFVRAAAAGGARILYDPNIRSPHKHEIAELRGLVHENISLAGIVRGSDEDFQTIFGALAGDEAYDIIKKNGGKVLVYTRSSHGVDVFFPGGRITLDVPQVDVVSTIGAGDSFNAGLIYSLFRSGKQPGELDKHDFEKMVKTAISFGSHACTHYENYISREFAAGIRKNR
jgi:fructokinase